MNATIEHEIKLEARGREGTEGDKKSRQGKNMRRERGKY
jgi:hypothetical protein